MRQSRRTVALAGAVAAVVVGVSGCSSDDGEGGDGTSAVDAQQTATEFLAAWADGDTDAAAAMTDDPEAAAAALAAYTEDAGVTELSLTPGPGSEQDGAVEVPFQVAAQVAHEDDTGDWGYGSALTVVADPDAAGGDGADGQDAGAASGGLVQWRSEILHPDLTEGLRLEIGPAAGPAPVRALDRDGDELDVEAFPSLAPVIEALAAAHGEAGGGHPGTELRITGPAPADGDAATDEDEESEESSGADGADGDGGAVSEQLLRLSEPTTGEVPTTIDPRVQRAAEAAVADSDRASLVAIRPSTGEILAVVNNPADGENVAMEGRYAPGSTWKIVTSGMLVEEGLAKADAAHPCPKIFDFEDWPFQNLDEFEIKGGTFGQSFAASCNTAFISAAPELADTQLAEYAQSAFGIGLEWRTGVETMSGSLNEESKAQMAAQLIGQASVRANPLVMASVSATVKDGTFRQPYLVPMSFDDREPVTAPGPSASTSAELRKLMALTVAGGTATEAMSGVPGDTGAKTGSAEVFDQKKPNAWFTAYRDDLAVAAVVRESGHGGKFAGPLVAEVLREAGGE
ncbi:penicillin-binding transpeptidase domain-containing protein [Streptomyces spiramenti]|uniref:Penicillin-binding protein n=1 Tax=Streptomyces spiramenti TaxID=2720606 RepID=A0ABX1ARW1_9ACTN|nr:penicillin-binding transpeptidase domain-containing protein [Streptomyces spiramenti]NJP68471.1 penicillin-binding protein [Streptomyces spiramenti]